MKTMPVLVAVVAAITFGCNGDVAPVGPTPITIVNSNVNTNNAGGGGFPEVPEPTTNNVVTLNPSSLVLEVDRRAATSVTVATVGGVNVPAGDITVTIYDTSVVMFSEVIGERLFLRGVNVGQTTVIVHAAGSAAELSVNVVPQ